MKWIFNVSKIGKAVQGSISVMLSIVLCGCLSLTTLLVEAGRYKAAQQEIEEAVLSSGLSTLAQCNSDLQKYFGLYGISDTKYKENDSYKDYLNFNSNIPGSEDKLTVNDFSKLYNLQDSNINYFYDLANYQVLKRQMLEYEKYRAPLNLAEEWLDLDKLLKDLVKQIEGIIPGLQNILAILDSIADIYSALQAIYKLEKTIEILQLSIGADSISQEISNFGGKLWQGVAEFFSGNEWNVCDPTYLDSYSSLESAINDKASYMRDHPAPPEPTGDIASLEATKNSTYKTYHKALVLYLCLRTAFDLDYCDESGIVNGSAKIGDFFDKLALEERAVINNQSYITLNKNMSRNEFFDKVNVFISNEWGASGKMQPINKANLESAKNTADSKRSATYSSYSSALSAYNAEKRKREAYDQYQNDISDKNDAINSCRDTLKGTVTSIHKQLDGYEGVLKELPEKLAKATDACKTISQNMKQVGRIQQAYRDNKDAKEYDKKEPMSQEDFEKLTEMQKTADTVGGVFDTINNFIKESEIVKAENGKTEMNRQKSYLENMKAEEINSSSSFTMGNGDLPKDGKYFMTKTQSINFVLMIEGLQIFKTLEQISQMVDGIKKLWDVFKPWSMTFEADCNVELNASTSSILPSKLNGGNGSTTDFSTQSDANTLSSILDDVRTLTGNTYVSDINDVDPAIRHDEDDLMSDLTAAFDRIENNLSLLFNNNKDTIATTLLDPALGFLVAIVTIIKVVPLLKDLYTDIKFVFTHMKEAFSLILSSLGENLLLNSYAVGMFSNRLTDKNNNNQNEEKPSWYGYYRTLFPDNSMQNQTFSGAHVEYILSGKDSEKANQRGVFWKIFFLRLINNTFCLFTDETAMELISACSFLAPVVFILWDLYESVIDMNLLLDVQQEIPFIKLGLVLSPNTLMSSVDNLIDHFETYGSSIQTGDPSYGNEGKAQINETVKKLVDVDALLDFEIDYEGYLTLFLFLTSNRKKTLRMADLIQMQIRYKQYSTGETVDFLMENADTYVRLGAEGTFNSILPVIWLSNDGVNRAGLKVKSVKYVGY